MIRARTHAAGGAGEAGAPALWGLYASVAGASTLFAVWGSLFPFDFRWIPLATASARFWSAWPPVEAGWSLSDLVSNDLLFVPIGLFLAGATVHGWPRRRAGAAVAVLAAAAGVSVTVEFMQAFVSWRTPSVIDVAAETLGAATGVALWRIIGTEIDALVHAAMRIIGRSTKAERLLLVYAGLFAVGWLLPADVTLRPAEIGDKYLHKRLLLPFTPSPDAATRAQLWFAAAAAIPLGAAATWCGCAPGTRRSTMRGVVIATGVLLALEVAQVPVFSRTTDGTLLLAAVAGAVAGALAAARARRDAVVVRRPATPGLVTAGLVLACIVVAAIVEWWPFHLVLTPARASVETVMWSHAPFRPPSGPADVVPGALLAVAAGLLLRRRVGPRFVRLRTLVVLSAGAVLFFTFEAGRVLLAAQRPTLTSVLIKTGLLAVALHAERWLSPLVPTHGERRP